MTYPRLNTSLLFHSDQDTKLRLIAEISKYMSNKFSMNQTRGSFERLIHLIADPDREKLLQVFYKDDRRGPLIGWTSRQPIIIHLKRLARKNVVGIDEYPLLRLVYLSSDQDSVQ